ncbi:MAG: hypothetical protein OXH61_01475 [Acidimicrobiaceae bacterium]|nr:hypothetical protein [Acidimicrobiaceae bacterium]
MLRQLGRGGAADGVVDDGERVAVGAEDLTHQLSRRRELVGHYRGGGNTTMFC